MSLTRQEWSEFSSEVDKAFAELPVVMKRVNLTWYTDPGHGWLKVRIADIESLGLSLSDFSAFSYRGVKRWKRGDVTAQPAGVVFLEEDCDAPIFIKALLASGNVTVNHVTHHTNKESRVRSFPSITWRGMRGNSSDLSPMDNCGL